MSNLRSNCASTRIGGPTRSKEAEFGGKEWSTGSGRQEGGRRRGRREAGETQMSKETRAGAQKDRSGVEEGAQSRADQSLSQFKLRLTMGKGKRVAVCHGMLKVLAQVRIFSRVLASPSESRNTGSCGMAAAG